MKEREQLIEQSATCKLSVRKQSNLLSINRSNLYYKPREENAENIKIMHQMDKHNLEHPTHGVLRMQDYLFSVGFVINVKKVRRLLRKMNIMAIYPKRNLSKVGDLKYKHPYLLKNLTIDRPNQVWEIDITYIAMQKGFMYLTAIIDVYSRYIVGWSLSNSLAAENSLNTLKEAILEHGKPEIVNSDQGSQFTCLMWVEHLEKEGVKISMDSKGRALDNIYIERFWRTIKQDCIYLRPAANGQELYRHILGFMKLYNTVNSHQGIGREIPINRYKMVA
jgi:putative transposase